MLNFGVRGHDMPQAPFEEWVKSIHDAGFTCTQLALSKAIHDFNVSDEAMTSGMANYMKRVFLKNDVDVCVLGCYKNLADPDKEKLEKTINSYKTHIRFASYLGCGLVGTETGAVNTEYKYSPENHTDSALETFIENLKRVVEYAEKMGVCVGIEPVYKHIMYNTERTRKVLDAVDSTNLRVILDPINLFNAENESQQHEIIDSAFELFGEEIDVIHMKDYKVVNGEIISRPVTLGEGQFDIPYLFSILKKRKPCICMSLEDSTPDNVQKSLAYVKKCYDLA